MPTTRNLPLPVARPAKEPQDLRTLMEAKGLLALDGRGMELMAEGKFREALDCLVFAAENGSVEACSQVAFILEKGEEVPRDLLAARAWHEHAAGTGDMEAIKAFVAFLERHIEEDKQSDAFGRAALVEWRRRAAEKGCLDAMYDLVFDLMEAGDEAGALRWLTTAAEFGCARAQCNLGLMHVDEEPGVALFWLRRAAAAGLEAAREALTEHFPDEAEEEPGPPELSVLEASRFEDLVRLDHATVQELVRRIELSTLVAALREADVDLRWKFQRNLSERAWDLTVEEMFSRDAVTPEEAAEAREEIMAALRELQAYEVRQRRLDAYRSACSRMLSLSLKRLLDEDAPPVRAPDPRPEDFGLTADDLPRVLTQEEIDDLLSFRHEELRDLMRQGPEVFDRVVRGIRDILEEDDDGPSMSEILASLGRILDRQDAEDGLETEGRDESPADGVLADLRTERRFRRRMKARQGDSPHPMISEETWHRAQAGDPDAMYEVGFEHYASVTSPDEAEAVKWIRAAAERNHGEALWLLGRMTCGHDATDQVETSVEKGLELLEAAGRAGCAKGWRLLSAIYRYGHHDVVDMEKAARYGVLAAEAGDELEALEWAERYELGDGVPQDLNLARHLLEVAAEKGDIRCATPELRLARMYRVGVGVRQDPARAAEWLARAGAKGHAEATDDDPEDDRAEAADNAPEVIERLFKAAYAGSFAACRGIAGRYAEGRGLPQDAAKAEEWRNTAERIAPEENSSDDDLAAEWEEALGPSEDEAAAGGVSPLAATPADWKVLKVPPSLDAEGMRSLARRLWRDMPEGDLAALLGSLPDCVLEHAVKGLDRRRRMALLRPLSEEARQRVLYHAEVLGPAPMDRVLRAWEIIAEREEALVHGKP